MKKILVIEDEEDLNQTLSFNLENEGYKVTSALKGSEALEILENASPPDLVILDLMLPDMPGLDICRHIRSKDNLKNTNPRCWGLGLEEGGRGRREVCAVLRCAVLC